MAIAIHLQVHSDNPEFIASLEGTLLSPLHQPQAQTGRANYSCFAYSSLQSYGRVTVSL